MATGGLAAWLTRVAPARARGLVSIAIVSDVQIKTLNRRFRRVNHATDVLSFPNIGRSFQGRQPVAGLKGPRYMSNDTSEHLGDIVIARGVARRQAKDAGHSERTEWRVLALHGLLHLLGYDHEGDNGRMQRVERRLRRKGGLRDGLIDRAHA